MLDLGRQFSDFCLLCCCSIRVIHGYNLQGYIRDRYAAMLVSKRVSPRHNSHSAGYMQTCW